MPPHPDSRTLLTTLAAIALSLAATTLARALATVRARRAALARLPAAPGGGSWAVGHTADMLAPDFHLRLSQWKADLGPIFTIRGVVGSRAVVVADPVSLATAVGARGRSAAAPTSPATPASLVPFPKWRPAYGVMDGVWGGSTPSIFTAAGLTPRWRAVRRATAPCFSAAAIRGHFPLIASRLGGLGDALVAGAGLPTKGAPFQVAMDGACMRLALDVIGMVRGARDSEGKKRGVVVGMGRGDGQALSLSQNTRPASPPFPQAAFGKDFHAVSGGPCPIVETLPIALAEAQADMTDPLRRLKGLLSGGRGRRDPAARAASVAAGAFRAEIGALVDQVHTVGGPPGSVAAALHACVDPDTGARLTPGQLVGEVATFIMGGFETTAHSLAFTLLRLAGCPGALGAVEAELQGAGLLVRGGKGGSDSLVPGRPLEHADLRALPASLAAVREAMRLHPTVPGMPRLTDRDVVLGGHAIPAGTMVYCLLRAAHREEGVWGPDAGRFRPGRWLEEGEGEEEGEDCAKAPSPASPLPASPRVKAFTPAAARGGRVGGGGFVSGTADGEEGGKADPVVAKPSLAPSPPPASAPPPPAKAYFPFSGGARDCMGQTLAVAILQAAVVGLVTRFRLSLPPPGGAGDGDVCPASRATPDGVTGEVLELKEVLMLTAHPAGGAVLVLEERM